MSFLEKNSNNSFLLKIQVKTNARKQKIINDGNFLTIWLKSKPIQNKANKELIDILKKVLKIPANKIKIILGLKSKEKIVKIYDVADFNKDKIINILINTRI
ncbi:MAG: DUF167 domain-containing protein [Promethearchaeota archaeon]